MWGEKWGEMLWGNIIPVPLMSPGGLALLVGAFLILGVVMRRRHAPQWAMLTLGAMVVVVPLAAYASSLTVTHTFVNGTIADADEVNANFSDVKTAVDDNDSRITTLEGGVAGLEIVNSALVCAVAQFSNPSVACSSGKKVLGGGCSSTSTAANVLESYPLANNQWQCGFFCGGAPGNVTAYAICATAP